MLGSWKAVAPSRRRILVVDDDEELCQLLAQYLAPEGYDVEAVHDGIGGVDRAVSGDHAIVVLDVMLPDIRGFEVLRRVRGQSRAPVLMLTARGDDQDRILGLEMGADDYLLKPFNPRELCARIEAILRRTEPWACGADPHAPNRITVADVAVDKAERVARRGGEPVDLTTVEFDLLERFVRSAGHVLSREDLMTTVLGRPFLPYDRGIDNHVSNLRKKLGPSRDGGDRIKSIRGIGYQYVVTAPRSSGWQ
jgi:two-component system, OmpR family, response regulator CpxR